MKTVTELAREAGWTGYDSLDERLQRFHNLAIAQYRESLLAGVGEPLPIRLERVKGANESDWRENISKELFRVGDAVICWVNEGDLYRVRPEYTADQLAAAIAIERERCAQICDAHATVEGISQKCAAAIRGQT